MKEYNKIRINSSIIKICLNVMFSGKYYCRIIKETEEMVSMIDSFREEKKQENEKKKEMTTEEKMKELFDLMDEKAAAGELNEVEDDQAFQKEMEEEIGPMSESETAAFEYSMMMNQFEAMLADYERREAEEKKAAKAAEKAESKADAAPEQDG